MCDRRHGLLEQVRSGDQAAFGEFVDRHREAFYRTALRCWQPRGGQTMLHWVAAGVLEAAKGFRRLQGNPDMAKLVAALRARDQRLGIGGALEQQVA